MWRKKLENLLRRASNGYQLIMTSRKQLTNDWLHLAAIHAQRIDKILGLRALFITF